MDEVYIILINYNGWKDTISCVKSIQKNEKNANYKIVVVDNASTDGSVEKLRKVKDIILIESKENLGFAKGNNLGITYAIEHEASYIMLLNNDTEIEENAISILKEKLKEDSSLGAIGSRIMYYDNRELIQYCGGHFNWKRGITVHDYFKKSIEEVNDKFFYTEFITGCSLMIKTSIIKKIGMLPEEYFMYFEDADFCVKIKENNYKLGVCTDSIIYHKVSASSGGEDSPFSIKWMTRNRLVFINKYKQYTEGVATIFFFYITRLIKIISYRIKGKNELAKAIKEGIKEGIKIVRREKDSK